MPPPRHTRLDTQQGVAVLTLDHAEKSANILSADVLEELDSRLTELEASQRQGGKLLGLVIASGKPGVFIAGADLAEFVAGLDLPKQDIVALCRRGQALFTRLSQMPFPTVAAIDGVCLGGGAELAVWCDRRVIADSEKTQIGFPEVKLGLFPGWGGTARTPRLVGLANAVELVTGGEPVEARAAARLGLADDLVPAGAAVEAAVRMALLEQASGEYLRDRDSRAVALAVSEAELGFLGATASAVIQQQTGGRFPAPLAALELMLEAAGLDLAAACQLEAERFAPLFGSPENRALLNVFFLQDRAKKHPPLTQAVPASRVSVIGAGVMGQGIAAAHVRRGVPVLLADNRPEAVPRAIQAVVREAAYDKQTKGPTVDRALAAAALVASGRSDTELAGASLVIEAVFEDLQAKRELFARLAPLAGPETILCTNTSTIPVSRLAEGLPAPERFCGLHFFNPVRKMPLVEVIRGAATSDATVAAATAHARRLGKTPIVVADGPGFLVNRLLLPYMNEAALLVEEGAPLHKVDSAAKRFGMPMGPVTLFDVVGLDVAKHAGEVMALAFPDRMAPAQIVPRLVAAGRLGQKNGRGFYDYPPGRAASAPKGTASEEVAELIRSIGRSDISAVPGVDLADRLLLPMLLEATRALDEGIVSDVRDVDLALVLGIGFPPHVGGLFYWADRVGAAEIVRRLAPLRTLGARFEPTARLLRHADSGLPFYAAPRQGGA